MEPSETALRQGAWAALEHAGRLLDSAVILFERGLDFETPMALANKAGHHIELNRLRRQLADRIASDASFSTADVNAAIGSPHTPAWLPVFRTEANTALRATLRVVATAHANGHDRRWQVLVNAESVWHRPHHFAASDHFRMFTAVLEEYATERDRVLSGADRPMARAAATMNPVPDLLPCRWPVSGLAFPT